MGRFGWFILALAGAVAATSPTSAAVDVGQEAPGFEAASTAGTVRLADYRGRKNVILAFYFKDFTGG